MSASAADTALERYRSKRDFRRTPEPEGEPQPRQEGRLFVIQKHAARRLHYDLRLEYGGVLLSWAVTRAPSLNPADKRLAVRTEDHPIAYGDFEGVIPAGEYGAGTVMLWDRGSWDPLGDPDEGLGRGVLKFRLQGERLKGRWALVRLKDRRGRKSGRENWLLVKERDEEARRDGDDLVRRAQTSVASGCTMAQIAKARRVWTRAHGDSASQAEPPPAFVLPQLATLVEAPPAGEEWLHEIKFDGYRALAALSGGEVIIRTRSGLDWTTTFQALVAPLRALPCRSAHLDGEVVVADDRGRTDFGALQKALSAGGEGVVYYLFDLLWLDGMDLRGEPLTQRKAGLQALLANVPAGGPLLYSDHQAGEGPAVFRKACEMGLEGIVSKRADAHYRSGRSRSWLKVKCGQGQEFVIVGWRPSRKPGRPFSSILLAVHEDGALRYAGRVGSGFSAQDLDRLARAFKKLAVKSPPVPDLPPAVRREARFVKPELVADVALRGWTRDGLIRQGSFKGLRLDKPPRHIVKEEPVAPRQSSPGGGDAQEIEGVRVTNPERVLFSAQGATKRDLIDYYRAVAGRILPHLRGRPLSLVRCPQGSDADCFYQKHASAGFPAAFRRVMIAESSGEGEYLHIEDLAGLVAAVQMGVLELHVWGCRVDRIERPDRMVFDFDPHEDVSFDRVKEGAREMRVRLQQIGLESFVLATGGKGLHVVVPLERRHQWPEHKDFAQALAQAMASDSPERYTTNMSKRARAGRIFIDYLRNDRGATAIAPYSTRSRPGAPVAFPLSWDALGRLKDARPATLKDAPARIARQSRDPWQDYFSCRQALPLAKLRRAARE